MNPTHSLGTTATAGDLALWNAKQKHAYAILSSCLLESGSQQIVRRYSSKDDPSTFGHAQHIYRDLVTHFQHGVAASTSLDTLEREIVALRLGKKWNKTLEAFLLLADHKLRDHPGLADRNNYPDSWYIKKLNAMFSGHAEITSYLRQLQVQEFNYLRLSGVAVTTALTYELHYTQIRDFCITLDGRSKEATEMNHARSIMKAEIKRSMNLSQAAPGMAPSTAQPARGHGSGRSRGQGRGRGRGGRDHGRGQSGGRGCYHNYLPDDQYWNLGQSSYGELVHDRISRGEIQSNNVDTQPLPSNSSTPSSVVPPAITTTTPVVPDAPSALTTPTRQVHTAHVTPSTAGSTSTQMYSGPPTLLRQMLSSASARSQPAAPDGSITSTFGGHQYTVRHINHTLYRYSYDIHENRIQSTHGALVDSGANGGMAGPDTRVLSIVPNAHVEITGISGSPIEQLPLVQYATLVNTLDEGQVILIMSQYAHSPKAKPFIPNLNWNLSVVLSMILLFVLVVNNVSIPPKDMSSLSMSAMAFSTWTCNPLLMMTSIITPMSFSLPTPHGILTMSTKNSIMMPSQIPLLHKTHFFKAFRMHVVTVLTLMWYSFAFRRRLTGRINSFR